jgi:hypothetical protein
MMTATADAAGPRGRGGRRKASAFVTPRPTESQHAMLEAARFVRRVDALVNASPKPQKRIASEMGYRNPNIVSMFKRGTTRVPFDKVPALALSVGADPVELLRLWLEEYEPQMVLIIERHFGTFLSAVPNTHTQYDRVRLRPPGVLPNGVAEAERNAAGE